jgi:hypothetical protein
MEMNGAVLHRRIGPSVAARIPIGARHRPRRHLAKHAMQSVLRHIRNNLGRDIEGEVPRADEESIVCRDHIGFTKLVQRIACQCFRVEPRSIDLTVIECGKGCGIFGVRRDDHWRFVWPLRCRRPFGFDHRASLPATLWVEALDHDANGAGTRVPTGSGQHPFPGKQRLRCRNAICFAIGGKHELQMSARVEA